MFETLYMFNILDGKLYPLLADGDYVWNDDLEDYEDVWVERPAEFGTAPLARVWGFSFEPAASQQ